MTLTTHDRELTIAEVSGHRRCTEAERLELLRRHRTAVRAQLDQIIQSLAAIDIRIAGYEERNTSA